MADHRWIFPPGLPTTAARRLVCLPYAGGGATVFHGWQAALGGAADVVAVQLPGRQNRLGEPAAADVASLLPPLADGLAPLLDRPYALFGYSMGALIAYELAQHLAAAGARAPERLLVAAHGAPHRPRRGPVLHDLPDAAFWEALAAYHGVPQTVSADPEMRTLFEPLLRADFALVETYRHRPRPPLSCPVSAFGGRDDAVVPREALAAWGELTRGPFDLTLFAGGHFFLREHGAALLAAVAERLAGPVPGT